MKSTGVTGGKLLLLHFKYNRARENKTQHTNMTERRGALDTHKNFTGSWDVQGSFPCCVIWFKELDKTMNNIKVAHLLNVKERFFTKKRREEKS